MLRQPPMFRAVRGLIVFMVLALSTMVTAPHTTACRGTIGRGLIVGAVVTSGTARHQAFLGSTGKRTAGATPSPDGRTGVLPDLPT